ncbi:MAG: hypothetical protein IT219_09840 [Bacteroidales bacterium]|nr:hypothetical protein [Bacteroidales bacterium]
MLIAKGVNFFFWAALPTLKTRRPAASKINGPGRAGFWFRGLRQWLRKTSCCRVVQQAPHSTNTTQTRKM